MRYCIILGILLIATTLATAQNDLHRQGLEERVESQRIAFITDRVKLTPEEAQVFWPLYNEYREKEKSLRSLRKTDKLLLDMNDSEASVYLDKLIEAEQSELEHKKAYTENLKSVLSPKKILRFYIAERQFKERLVQLMSQRRERMQERRSH